MKPCCSYCGNVVTSRHTFSYGVPGVRRVLACSRWRCRWFRQRFRVRLVMAWYDFWIGLYWDGSKRRLYVLPVPCLGLRIDFRPKPTFPKKAAEAAGGEA